MKHDRKDLDDMADKIRILIADDFPLLREDMAEIIDSSRIWRLPAWQQRGRRL